MIHSFLMIGQSNMAGRGDLEDVGIIQSDKLFMLRNGRWRSLVEPVNYDRTTSGISLAVSFAHEFTKKYNKPAGLIPCAEGGSAILEWEPGGQLYTHAVYLCLLAKRISNLSGILWHQGESDCTLLDDINSYKQKFSTMIDTLMRELEIEGIPVITGELGYFLDNLPDSKCQYYMEINSILHKISKERSNFAVASAKGLTAKPDGVHFDSRSCREFGTRYFNEFVV